MSKKPYIHKRIIAYIVDILIISMIATLISMPFSNNEKYEEVSKELYNITNKYKNEEIKEEQYLEEYNNINYELTKINISQTIIIIIISSLYFILFNYYNNGQTIGKRLMKLRIVSNNDDKVSINSYIIRTLIVNTTLSNLLTVILILTLSKEKYLIYESKFSAVFGVIYILCFVFALYRNDGKGLHDLLANTLVVNEKKEQEIKDAIVINEKINEDEEVK